MAKNWRPLQVILMLVPLVFLASSVTVSAVQLIGPPGPVVARLGEDAVLPCQLDPQQSAAEFTVDWRKTQAGSQKKLEVNLYLNGKYLNIHQDPSYHDRTELSEDHLKNGDLSLKLRRVKQSDAGEYECVFVQTPPNEVRTTVKLIVDAAPAPVTSSIGINNSGVVLQCEAQHLNYLSEVEWLDSEGHVLSAGPTETLKEPDGTFTVRRNVTVEKTATNRFTCRVIQQTIHHKRETEIYVPEKFFPVESSTGKYIGIGILIGILIVIFSEVAIGAIAVRLLGYKVSFTRKKMNATKDFL